MKWSGGIYGYLSLYNFRIPHTTSRINISRAFPIRPYTDFTRSVASFTLRYEKNTMVATEETLNSAPGKGGVPKAFQRRIP